MVAGEAKLSDFKSDAEVSLLLGADSNSSSALVRSERAAPELECEDAS